MEALRKKPTGGANGPSSEAGTHAHEGSCDAARSAKPSAISSKAAGVSTGLLANMASDRHTPREVQRQQAACEEARPRLTLWTKPQSSTSPSIEKHIGDLLVAYCRTSVGRSERAVGGARHQCCLCRITSCSRFNRKKKRLPPSIRWASLLLVQSRHAVRRSPASLPNVDGSLSITLGQSAATLPLNRHEPESACTWMWRV